MTIQELSTRALEIRKQFAAFEQKRWDREWKTEDIALGLTGDVGDLVKLIQTKEGIRPPVENIDAALAHELSDCLWCLFVLANVYGIDIEKQFMKTMDELESWLALNADGDK